MFIITYLEAPDDLTGQNSVLFAFLADMVLAGKCQSRSTTVY